MDNEKINETNESEPPLFWASVVKNHRSHGREVMEIEYGGDIPNGEPTPRFVGIGMLMIQMQRPEGIQQIPHQFEFPINAETVREAFMRFGATYREAAKREDEKIKRQMADQQRRLVIPQGGFTGAKELKA